MLNTAAHDRIYRIGSRIEIDYVMQRHRPQSSDKGAEIKQILEIRIAESPRPK
jgi:hypothetical protein